MIDNLTRIKWSEIRELHQNKWGCWEGKETHMMTEFALQDIPNSPPACISTHNCNVTLHLLQSRDKIYFPLNLGWACNLVWPVWDEVKVKAFQSQGLALRSLEFPSSISLSLSLPLLCTVVVSPLVPAEGLNTWESPAKTHKATDSPQLTRHMSKPCWAQLPSIQLPVKTAPGTKINVPCCVYSWGFVVLL